MADFIATVFFILFLIACGLGPACNFKGPGLGYKVDGVQHHLLLANDK